MTTAAEHERERQELDRVGRIVDRHETELHSPRGIYAGMKELSEQIKWTNRALWGVAASVMVGSALFIIQSVT